jgi:excinuclease ABC subunit C
LAAPPARLQPALPGGLEAALVSVPLETVEAALAALPAAAGVAQFVAAGDRNLLIGKASNLRRWASNYLGAGPPPKPGQRPPLDLRPVAASVRFATSEGEFQQRLLFERLMARHVPLSARRDLKPPAWLHLDVTDRFPRLSARTGRAAQAGGPLFGPFRDSRAASRARDALHKRLPLRPCDYTFEPHPELPLGLGCVYAQTRSCAAPCLQRASADEYRAVARAALELLGGPRAEDPDLPGWVAARESRAAIVDPTKGGLGVYPVRDGRVLEQAALLCAPEQLEEALHALEWPAAADGDPDWPWLLSWLHAPKRKGRYLVLEREARAVIT